MIDADLFVRAAQKHGLMFYSGVPCSYLQPLINFVSGSSQLRYVGAANEGDAVATAAGASLSGVGSVVLMQNSGLGNAVNPLTSLTWPFRIPILMVTTLRGEPGGPADEPQHELMGAITTQILTTMKIPWEFFPERPEQVEGAVDKAVCYMREASLPYALVLRKGAVAPFGIAANPPCRVNAKPRAPSGEGKYRRRDMLGAIRDSCREDDVIVATTGYTSRELYELGDAPNHFYMVGSMGCASSFALGIALTQSRRRVIVIDGDGAAIMRLGAMTTIGGQRPKNLVHIVLDNQVHESTGGQPTASGTIDFCAVAAACGYPHTVSADTPDALGALLRADDTELSFVHVPIQQGIERGLSRPGISPAAVARRLEALLKTRCTNGKYSSLQAQ
jgi:phosphonopyruvate decarboxylase